MSERTPDEIVTDIVTGVLRDIVIKAVAARAVAALPFLGAAWINPIFMFILAKVVDLVAEESARLLTVIILDIDVNLENKAYKKAVLELRAIMRKPKEEQNADEIEAARLELEKKLAGLIHLHRG